MLFLLLFMGYILKTPQLVFLIPAHIRLYQDYFFGFIVPLVLLSSLLAVYVISVRIAYTEC